MPPSPLSSSSSSSVLLNSISPLAMVGYALAALPQKTDWLDSLLAEKFFAPCAKHVALKKNEKNIYCVDCSLGICQHCLANHSSHRLLQIRRYVYHDVIRLQDIQKLVDCSQVQTYIINSARVVFLNQRPQPRPSKGLGNVCQTCERSLQDAYRYCSVACKVDAVLAQGKDLQNLLPRCNSLHLTDSATPSQSLKCCELENEEQLSPNSVLEATSSGSTANDRALLGWDKNYTNGVRVAAPTKIDHRNREASDEDDDEVETGTGLVVQASLAPQKRRKGTPHRAPFC